MNLIWFLSLPSLKNDGIKSRPAHTYVDPCRVRSIIHRHFVGFTGVGCVSIIGSNTSPPTPWQRREIAHVSALGFTFLLNWSYKYSFLTWGVNIASFVHFGNPWLYLFRCQQEYILCNVVTSTLYFWVPLFSILILTPSWRCSSMVAAAPQWRQRNKSKNLVLKVLMDALFN